MMHGQKNGRLLGHVVMRLCGPQFC